MKVQRSIEIAAPPHKIWTFLVEPEKILKWCIIEEKFEYTGEHRTGVGTHFYFEEKAAGRLMKLNFTTTEWMENEKLAFRMVSGNFLKHYERRCTVEATASGSRFTFTEQIELPYGLIGKIIGLFARFSMQAAVKKMLGKLKSLAEV